MITHGTVTVTAWDLGSQASAYSSSACSSNADDEDSDEEQRAREDGDDGDDNDHAHFLKVFSPNTSAGGDDDDNDDDPQPGGRSHIRGDSASDDGGGYCDDAYDLGYIPLREESPPRPQHTGAKEASKETASEGGGVAEEGGASEGDPASRFHRHDQRNRERWSGIDSIPTEKVLTRLYEGNCFGEMALIYDEPRNASVRATTEVTCVYLHKDAFRRCLCDKTFNKLMEQAALQTACLREQREILSGKKQQQRQRQQNAVGDESPPFEASTKGGEPATKFAKLRALAAARGGTRSSFKATEQLRFATDEGGETNVRMINDYRVCEKIGEGSFGSVYKVVHVHTEETNAMKVGAC